MKAPPIRTEYGEQIAQLVSGFKRADVWSNWQARDRGSGSFSSVCDNDCMACEADGWMCLICIKSGTRRRCRVQANIMSPVDDKRRLCRGRSDPTLDFKLPRVLSCQVVPRSWWASMLAHSY